MLVDFFEGQPALASQRGSLAGSINNLARSFRGFRLPIIWVRQEFKPDLSDAFLAMRRSQMKVTIEGTAGCEILPELERLPGEPVIVKKRYSAFFGTQLDALLGNIQAETLVLAGINTHACIRTTAVDAYQRDFDVIIATDCVSSYDDEHHRVTLRYLESQIARLMSGEEIARTLHMGT